MATFPFLLLAATLTAASAAPAAATEADPAERVYVHFGDLDLAKTDGRDALSIRIAQAAKRVCLGHSIERLNLRDHLAYVKCRSATIRDAQQQLASRPVGAVLALGGPLHVAAD